MDRFSIESNDVGNLSVGVYGFLFLRLKTDVWLTSRKASVQAKLKPVTQMVRGTVVNERWRIESEWRGIVSHHVDITMLANLCSKFLQKGFFWGNFKLRLENPYARIIVNSKFKDYIYIYMGGYMYNYIIITRSQNIIFSC